MRRRFIQMREPPYDFIEVSEDYDPPPRGIADACLWNDRNYENLRATDGTPINSRSKHRQYMAQRGLTTADDFTNEWKNATKRRAEYFSGTPGTGAVSREDISKAIHQLESAQNKRKS